MTVPVAGVTAVRGAARLQLALAVVVGLFVLFNVLPLQAWMTGFQAWVEAFGAAGPAVYVGAYILAAVLFVPASALSLMAGVVFGPWQGTALVSVASTTSAGLAFLIARYAARPTVEQWVAGNPRMAALDAAVAESGWRIVALTRLSPAFPFNLLNYAFGLTRVGFWPFLLTSWLAMLPGTCLYVMGAAAAAGAASASVTWGHALALAGALGVTVYVTRMARKALAGVKAAA